MTGCRANAALIFALVPPSLVAPSLCGAASTSCRYSITLRDQPSVNSI